MSGKNLVLKLNAKMLSANHIAEFLNFNISKTIGGITLVFACKCISIKATNQIDDVISHEWGQGSPGMPKEDIKRLISQKLLEV